MLGGVDAVWARALAGERPGPLCDSPSPRPGALRYARRARGGLAPRRRHSQPSTAFVLNPNNIPQPPP